MRVVIKGTDDVAEFTNINGTWVSADCGLVTVEFAWQRIDRKPTVSEADCCCSHELAAKLVRLLFSESSEHGMVMIAPTQSQVALGGYHLPV